MSVRHRACMWAVVALTAIGGGGPSAVAAKPARSLEEDFRDPPASARVYVWWHWMGPNFSKAGITKDLEAMKATGIAGATIFNIASSVGPREKPIGNSPWPDQTFRSPKYWEALRHAAAEAERLGLEIGLHNTPGYQTTGGPWIDEGRAMRRLYFTSVKVAEGKRISVKVPEPRSKPEFGWASPYSRPFTSMCDVAVLAVPVQSQPVQVEQIIEVSEHLDADGTFTWDAPAVTAQAESLTLDQILGMDDGPAADGAMAVELPAGSWIVYRIAHGATGATSHPLPDDLLGKVLEADKLSADVTRYHWGQVLDPLQEHLGPWLGKSVRHILIDSYEAGYQNWTPKFREAFRKRKGYDPLPWLVSGPLFEFGGGGGRVVVGSLEQTQRFWWDFRDAILAMCYENGWAPGAEAVHELGCELQWEPYAAKILDTVATTPLADVPMVEFWTGAGRGGLPTARQDVVLTAYAAGRRTIGAEAFTGGPKRSQWTETPAFLKVNGDAMFATGVNRMILHQWVHQPFDDRYQPAFGMGWWGTHFNRHQTWYELGKAYFRYLNRCQAMLQRGATPSTVVTVGESIPNTHCMSWQMFFADVAVEDGRIALPRGNRYDAVSVPYQTSDGGEACMEPKVLHRIKALLEAGATVAVGRKKPAHAPGLSGYPDCDVEVRKLADAIWGAGEPDYRRRRVGRGTLVLEPLANQDIGWVRPPDWPRDLRIRHRREGTADWYFVANGGGKRIEQPVTFLSRNMQPELWNPETGDISLAPVWRAKGDGTEVDLALDAGKSIFVVFRRPLPDPVPDHVVAIEAKTTQDKAPSGLRLVAHADGGVDVIGEAPCAADLIYAGGRRASVSLPAPPPPMTVGVSWKVGFASSVTEVPGIEMAALQSLSQHADPRVRYFSGTATYRTILTVDGVQPDKQRFELDLGDVRDLARVRLNGDDLGVVWHPPFRWDVTAALRAGENVLEVDVSNTWHNRLVGDEQHPADVERSGQHLARFPDWLLKNEPRPQRGRKCFVMYFYHNAKTPLLQSGLIGPVTLQPLSLTHVVPPASARPLQ